jgi:hypothetical protein
VRRLWYQEKKPRSELLSVFYFRPLIKRISIEFTSAAMVRRKRREMILYLKE